MPLRRGKSRAAVSANIRELLYADYPLSQAIAISMRKAGIKRKKRRRGKKRRSKPVARRRALARRRLRSRKKR